MTRRKRDIVLCPICGNPVSWFERYRRNDRTYLYAVHYLGYEKVNGKVRKKVKKCYLGPVDHYVNVSRMHEKEGLTLYGVSRPDRVLSYLEALARFFERPDVELEFNSERLRELAIVLRRLADTLEGLADRS